MTTFAELLHCDGRTDRLTFQRNVALLAFGKSAVDLLAITHAPATDTATVALAWLNPFVLVGPWLNGAMPSAICASTLVFFSALVWNSVHRARDAGWPHWLAAVCAAPFASIAMALVLAMPPSKRRSVWDII